MKGTTLVTNLKALLEDGPCPGQTAVGGEFQPRLEIGNLGYDPHLMIVLN